MISRNSVAHAQQKQGFTLTEIAIVLGIIGLILGAIWTAASAVYANQRVAHANTAVLQIVQGIRTLYATTAQDVATLGTAMNLTDTLVCGHAVPADLVTATCGTPATLTGIWPNGTTAIYAPGTGDSFTIEMTNIPQSGCINLLMAVAGQNRDAGLFLAEGLAGPGAAAIPTATPALPATVTPASANAAPANNFGGCNANAGAAVAVDFAYTLK